MEEKRTDGDVHFVKRDGLDHIPFEALHVETEVVAARVADGQQDWVEREASSPGFWNM